MKNENRETCLKQIAGKATQVVPLKFTRHVKKTIVGHFFSSKFYSHCMRNCAMMKYFSPLLIIWVLFTSHDLDRRLRDRNEAPKLILNGFVD